MTQSLIKTGRLKYTSVQEIADKYEVNRLQVRNILGISESTQFRYEKSDSVLKPTIVDRWNRCIKIIERAQDLFENDAETKRWLSTPKNALDDKIPLDLLDTDSGCRQVEQILMQASYGVFA